MPHQMIAKKAVVAAGHPLGAQAGLEMLRDGGNAIDAAVAAMLALCVVIPGSVGIGGYGGSAVIRVAKRNGSRLSALGYQQEQYLSRQPIADSHKSSQSILILGRRWRFATVWSPLTRNRVTTVRDRSPCRLSSRGLT
jgi:gamma-glutamyltranspeptidase